MEGPGLAPDANERLPRNIRGEDGFHAVNPANAGIQIKMPRIIHGSGEGEKKETGEISL